MFYKFKIGKIKLLWYKFLAWTGNLWATIMITYYDDLGECANEIYNCQSCLNFVWEKDIIIKNKFRGGKISDVDLLLEYNIQNVFKKNNNVKRITIGKFDNLSIADCKNYLNAIQFEFSKINKKGR